MVMSAPFLQHVHCRYMQLVYSLARIAITSIAILTSLSNALEFDMAKPTKCIVEEISVDVLVVGEYQLYRKDGLFVSGTVTVRRQPPQFSTENKIDILFLCMLLSSPLKYSAWTIGNGSIRSYRGESAHNSSFPICVYKQGCW